MPHMYIYIYMHLWILDPFSSIIRYMDPSGTINSFRGPVILKKSSDGPASLESQGSTASPGHSGASEEAK